MSRSVLLITCWDVSRNLNGQVVILQMSWYHARFPPTSTPAMVLVTLIVVARAAATAGHSHLWIARQILCYVGQEYWLLRWATVRGWCVIDPWRHFCIWRGVLYASGEIGGRASGLMVLLFSSARGGCCSRYRCSVASNCSENWQSNFYRGSSLFNSNLQFPCIIESVYECMWLCLLHRDWTGNIITLPSQLINNILSSLKPFSFPLLTEKKELRL